MPGSIQEWPSVAVARAVLRFLRSEPNVAGYDRLNGRGVSLASPFKLSGIDTIARDFVNGGFMNRAAARQMLSVRYGQFLHGMLAGGARFMHAALDILAKVGPNPGRVDSVAGGESHTFSFVRSMPQVTPEDLENARNISAAAAK